MVNNFEVITLCGSTKFKDEFINAQKTLTLLGKIVISVGLFGHCGDDEVYSKQGIKETLDEIHQAKISLSDSIYVINKNDYIGESTKNEIRFARLHNKMIYFMEPTIYDVIGKTCTYIGKDDNEYESVIFDVFMDKDDSFRYKLYNEEIVTNNNLVCIK